MSNKKLQSHWEDIYQHKQPTEVSWTQDYPITTMELLKDFTISKQSKIIDIGGGDSKLVDVLLEKGFENITVLDISSAALEKAKKRLGDNAKKINWIVADVNEFEPTEKFDFWHDRAAFHFLTTAPEIEHYYSIIKKSTQKNAVAIIGTFSETGPDFCSGLAVKKYNETTLSGLLQQDFKKQKCITEDHLTPFNSKQNFLFCSFLKKEDA